MNGRAWWTGVLVLLVLAWPCASGADATEAAPGDPDPVVRDVLRMLDQGVAPAVVLAWLRQQPVAPGPLDADDVIRLHDAGASPELLRELVERTRRSEEAAARADAPPDAPTGRSSAAEAWLSVRVRYSPFVDTEYGAEDENHALFVYLDGELLARAPADSGAFSDGSVELRRRVAPGLRTVRLLRERHERTGRGDDARWAHESRIAPEILRLDLEPGHAYVLDVEWSESRFAFGRRGPLTWQLVREGERVAGERATGTRAEDWPELCEDVEACAPPDREPGKRIRRRLEDCVRWSSLWPGLDAFPTREQVLDFLARFDYRPAPASARP